MDTLFEIIGALVIVFVVKRLLTGANANIAIAKHLEDEQRNKRWMENAAYEEKQRRERLEELEAHEKYLYVQWKAGKGTEADFLAANNERCDFQNYRKKQG